MKTTRRGFLKGMGAVATIIATPSALLELGAPPLRYQGPPLEMANLTWSSVTGGEIVGFTLNGKFYNEGGFPVTPNGGDVILDLDTEPGDVVKLVQRDGMFFTEI